MTLFDLGQRFVGHLQEKPGSADHPYIRWSHSLTTLGESPDSVPWCSSWLNSIAWLLRLPRSKSAAARSWLTVGIPIASLFEAKVGYDVIVLNRGGSADPTVAGPGHVGIFAGIEKQHEPIFTGQEIGPIVEVPYVLLLAGNQANAVTIARFKASEILGIRRLQS